MAASADLRGGQELMGGVAEQPDCSYGLILIETHFGFVAATRWRHAAGDSGTCRGWPEACRARGPGGHILSGAREEGGNEILLAVPVLDPEGGD